jgi:glycosyltransferase involved in cell wall biosynthesis
LHSPIVAISPKDSPLNQFTGAFSRAVEQAGFKVVELSWGRPDLASYDVAILHWPDEMFRFTGLYTFRQLIKRFAKLHLTRRLNRTRYIWVGHNVRPHEGGRMSMWLVQQFLRSLDGIIFLSRHSRDEFHRTYAMPKGLAELVTVHGHYGEVMKTPVRPAPPLGDTLRLVHFGQVRPYKNVERLSEAVAECPAIGLTVTGKCASEELAAELRRIAASARNIALDLRLAFVPDEELEAAIDAAHAAVLPYKAILNSGSAFLALSRGRPVLAPASGSLPELREAVGAEWLYLYEGELTADVLHAFDRWMRGRDIQGMPDLSAYSWDRVSRDLGAFLGTIAPSAN